MSLHGLDVARVRRPNPLASTTSLVNRLAFTALTLDPATRSNRDENPRSVSGIEALERPVSLNVLRSAVGGSVGGREGHAAKRNWRENIKTRRERS